MAEVAKETGKKETELVNYRESLKQRRRDYETIFILSPTLDNKNVEELTSKAAQTLKGTDATVLRQDNWGKLRMAYEIEKHNQGHYFYFRYIGNGVSVQALERLMKLDTAFLRYQTVRLSEDLSEEEIEKLKQKIPNEKINPPHLFAEDEGDFNSFRH